MVHEITKLSLLGIEEPNHDETDNFTTGARENYAIASCQI